MWWKCSHTCLSISSNLLQLAAVILCLVLFWFILILCPRVSLLSQCLLWVSPSLGFPPFITSPVLFPASLTSPVPDPPRWCVCVFSLCSPCSLCPFVLSSVSLWSSLSWCSALVSLRCLPCGVFYYLGVWFSLLICTLFLSALCLVLVFNCCQREWAITMLH